MLVAFRRCWKLLKHLSTKDNERNVCLDLLTIENTVDSDLKVHVLHYANEPCRQTFLSNASLQTRQTNRKYKKLSKTGFSYD